MGSEMCIRDRIVISTPLDQPDAFFTAENTFFSQTTPHTSAALLAELDKWLFSYAAETVSAQMSTRLSTTAVPRYVYLDLYVNNMSPEPTRLLKLSKPLLPSRLRFWKLCSGHLGRSSCLQLATEPSLHSADGSSAAAISPGGFSAAGLWKAPLDSPLTRVPRGQ